MSAEESPSTLINIESAREKIPGGDAGLRQMAELLHSECARLMQELSDARAKDNGSDFRRAAHTLKSSAAVFGVTRVVEISRELEGAGKADKLDDVGDRLAELETLLTQLRKELESLTAQLAS